MLCNLAYHIEAWTKWSPFCKHFSNASVWMEMFELHLTFHWSLIPVVQFSIGLGNGLAMNWQQAITWTNIDNVLWRLQGSMMAIDLHFLFNSKKRLNVTKMWYFVLCCSVMFCTKATMSLMIMYPALAVSWNVILKNAIFLLERHK